MGRPPKKQRLSPGRRVLVGMMKRTGTVVSVSDQVGMMGEFVHDVLIDGQQQPLRMVGCDLEPLPDLDEDLARTRPAVHLTLQNSSVANLNLGMQVGTITAALESISHLGGADLEFAEAIKHLTEAVVSQTTMPDADKREVVDVLSTLAEESAKQPEQRSTGRLKAAVAWLPTAIAATANLVAIWNKFEPIIRAYFHL
jgi:hypothetical protein